MRRAYRIIVGRTERKRPPGRPKHRWKDSIKMDLKELVCADVNWIQLAADRVQWWAPEHGNEYSGSIKGS
jgi:hypothetical protein